MEPDARVELELWRADVIVLFDWLMSVDYEAIPIRHRAQKQALADLLTQIEQAITWPTEREIVDAQEAVARDMGW